MNVLDILTQTTKEGASDLFIVAGRPLSYKKNGKILQAGEERMMPHDCETFVREIYELAGKRDISRLFLHRHKKSIVSQREISSDTESYLTALRASLRQSPDVILLGEMRDFETISVAMTAAETGHLVLSTLHTLGAANTIDRIIDVFPPNQQRQISVQLSSVLHAVVSQQLVPSQDGKLVPAFELMTTTSAIRNMIRENKIHQIEGLIYSSSGKDMMSMDNSLLALYKAGTISDTEALAHASNPDMLKRKL